MPIKSDPSLASRLSKHGTVERIRVAGPSVVAVLSVGLLVLGCTPAEMTIWHYSPTQVNDLCSRIMTKDGYTDKGRVFGCALTGNDRPDKAQTCVVVLPHPSAVGVATYQHLYAHERRHCNGWKHS
jgi:hypothetical protein